MTRPASASAEPLFRLALIAMALSASLSSEILAQQPPKPAPLPSFVDDRRLPSDDQDAARDRAAQEAIERLKSESDRLRERLNAESEARRKAEEEAIIRRRSAEDQRSQQAEEAQRKAEEEAAATRKRAEDERSRQAAEAQRKAEEEAAATRKRAEDERARQAAEAQRKAEEEAVAARKRAEDDDRARRAAAEAAARKRAQEALEQREAETQRKAREAVGATTTPQPISPSRAAAGEIAARMAASEPCSSASVTGETREAARIAIHVQSNCLAGKTVTISYGNHNFARAVGATGRLDYVLDLFEGASPVAVMLADGTRYPVDTSGVDYANISKIAVLWTSAVNLDLHALEYLAPRGGPGHVWARAAGNLDAARAEARDGARGRGYMSTVDDGEGEGTKVEVYTFLHNPKQRQGAITLLIDYETRGALPTGPFCGDGELATIEAQVIRMRPGGRIEKEMVRLTSVPCGQKVPENVRYNSDTLSGLLAKG